MKYRVQNILLTSLILMASSFLFTTSRLLNKIIPLWGSPKDLPPLGHSSPFDEIYWRRLKETFSYNAGQSASRLSGFSTCYRTDPAFIETTKPGKPSVCAKGVQVVYILDRLQAILQHFLEIAHSGNLCKCSPGWPPLRQVV